MDEEFKQYLQKITEQLDALLKLIYVNTDKQELCQHIAFKDDLASQTYTTISSNIFKTFKIIECLNCGKKFTQEAK